ncbi:flagellar hook-associated protein FlgL [Litoribacillus peritrichatus]|uniref:Flagellar hook-associated protein FlgL n=1 Tax=Litoribacillus peritrichatus TaxID=718191 RepID=A0ABP7M3Q7_9GAMM
MAVRISSSQAFEASVSQMIDLNSQMLRTQEQISTSKKNLSAADDPLNSTRILQLQQSISLRDQYSTNLDTLDGALRSEESALDSIVTNIRKVRELTVSAGDGTYSFDDRKSIALEIGQRVDELLALTNTKDPNGEYIFAGFQGFTEPFVEQQDGRFIYQGDEGERFVKADEATNLARNNPGKEIFMDIPSENNTVSTSTDPTNSDADTYITLGKVVDQTVYDAFYPEDIVIEFNAETNVIPNGPNFTAYEKETGRPIVQDQSYVPGQEIQLEGVAFKVVGSPDPGDNFYIDSSSKQDIFTTYKLLEDGLNSLTDTPVDQEQLEKLLSDTLSNLDNALNSVINVQSDVGGRMNIVATSRETQEEVKLVSQEVLSDLQDLDYSEAVSRLSYQTFVLEATQLSYTRVTGLSLFNQL